MVWAGIYILTLAAIMVMAIAKLIQKKYVYWLIINVSLTLLFVCVFLGLTQKPYIAGIVSIVVFMVCVGAIPVVHLRL